MTFASLIDKKLNPYIVILGFSYRPDNYIAKIKKLKNDYQLDGIILEELNTELPILLWQWQKTNLSIHLSQFEPFGLAPCEARFLAKNYGPIVVTSDRGGLNEQIVNYKEGLICKYGSKNSYKKAIKFFYSLDDKQKEIIRINSYKKMMEKYNSYNSFVKFLNNFIDS